MTGRPRLRSSVLVRRLSSRHESYTMVRESESRSYYKFEDWEYDLLTAFDGTRESAEIAEHFSRTHPGLEIDEQSVVDYAESLRKLDLLERPERERHLVMMDRVKDLRRRRVWDPQSTLFQIRLPLFDPNRLMDRVIPYIRWVWSPWFVAPWVVVFVVLLGYLIHHWDLYWSGFFSIWNFPEKGFLDWVGFFALLIGVSIWHELGHGFTCKRFGGEVHDIGFMIFYMQPAFYCSIDDSYLFPKLSHRLYATLGGAYFELMMASAAAAFWLATPAEWWLHRVSLTVLFFTGLSVVVLNANPLIKLDGYYLLMDWLDVPQLREDSFQYIGGLFRRHVLRLEVSEKAIPLRRRRIYLLYGICSVAYTILLMTIILGFLRRWLVGAFGPLGYLLLVGLAVYALRKRIAAAGKFLRHLWLDKREFLASPAGRVSAGAVAVVVVVIVALIPTATRIDATFVVEPGRRVPVRTEVDAIVRSVEAVEAQHVDHGQVLATLEGVELVAARAVAAADERRARREAAAARAAGDHALERALVAAAQEAANRQALLSRRVGRLDLSAPAAGVISTPDLENSLGRFLAAGDEYCVIDQLDTVNLAVTISQRFADQIEPGMRVRARAAARPTRTIREKVLAVAPVGRPPDDSQPSLDLVRTAGTVRFDVRIENSRGLLRPGMSGRIQFLTRPRSLVGKLLWGFRRWLQSVAW